MDFFLPPYCFTRVFNDIDVFFFRLLGPTKGFAVHFGHPSWNMVLNMMVGVRLAGGRISNEPRRAVEAYDFVMKEKISILPRSDLSTSGDPRSRAFRNVVCVFVDMPCVGVSHLTNVRCWVFCRLFGLSITLRWCSVKYGSFSG